MTATNFAQLALVVLLAANVAVSADTAAAAAASDTVLDEQFCQA